MSQFIQVVFFKSSAYTANPAKYDSVLLAEFGKTDGVVACVPFFSNRFQALISPSS